MQYKSPTREDYHFQDILRPDFDAAPYNLLFERNAVPRADGVLKWRYQANPLAQNSSVLVANATSDTLAADDSIGALYAAMGVPFQINGETTIAAQSLDTLTDKNHRRKGLFGDLAKSAYEQLAQNGAQVVYGFPNGNSHHGFIKHLGWNMLDPLPFMFKPLRTGYFANKLKLPGRFVDVGLPTKSPRPIPAIDIRPMSKFDTQHDSLWQSCSKGIKVSLDRTSAYMNWRILKSPFSSKYKVLGAYSGDQLLGEIIWCHEEKHGGKVGYIMEVLYAPGREDLGIALLRHAIKNLQQQKTDLVLAWVDSNFFNFAAYKSCGFWHLPQKLRPIELHWGYAALNESSDTVLSDRNNWYISYLDSDTV